MSAGDLVEEWAAAWRAWSGPGSPLPAEPWLGEDSPRQYRPPSTNALRGLLLARQSTQAAAAARIGVNPRTMRKYCIGESPMQFSTWFALRTLLGRES